MLPDPIFLNVHMYGVMIAVGVLFALLLIYAFGRRMQLSEKFLDFIFYNGVFSILFGFGAASLFQALYNYISDPEKGFHITGGITFIGGLIGGAAFFLVVWFFFRRYPESRSLLHHHRTRLRAHRLLLCRLLLRDPYRFLSCRQISPSARARASYPAL